jgi:hypothetical protein
MEIRFLLICDGSSDIGLGNHIQHLLLQNGATEVNWTSSHSGGRLTEKIRLALSEANNPEMLFVHRDAERVDPVERHEEIRCAIAAAEYPGPWAGIVPRRMTEAWLLLDDPAMRRVVGRPRGTEPLDLPFPRDVERLPDPKERLREALLAASSPRGLRRRKQFNSAWAVYRNRLLENLPIGGPLEQVPSWVRFRDDTVSALRQLSN